MSTAAIVLLALTLVVVALTGVATAVIAFRVFRPPRQPLQPAATTEAEVEPQPESAPQAPSYFPAPILAAEYYDEAVLTTLAAELGVEVDPITTSTGSGQQRLTEVETSIDARLTLPGMADLASNISAVEAQSDLSHQAVVTTRRQGLTWILSKVARELADRDRLRQDLLQLPDSARELHGLAAGIIRIYDLWGLRDLAPTPAPAAPPPASSRPVTGAAASPGPLLDILTALAGSNEATPDQLARDAAVVVWNRTMTELVQTKQDELRLVADAPGVNFTLLRDHWRTVTGAGGSGLRLYNRSLFPATDAPDQMSLNSRALLEVPLNSERLTDSGEQRLVVGASFVLYVFGRIGAFSEENGTLIVHPIAIFAA